MKQYIKDEVYYLVDDQGKVLLKLTPTSLPNNQIELETEKSVFSGPIEFMKVE
jgi:hypothetical protein